MLLALLTGQRLQTLHAVKTCTDCMVLTASTCTFYLDSLQKHSRPNGHLSHLELKAYPTNANLCIVHHLKKYLSVTANYRPQSGDCRLLLSYVRPHLHVSTDTISRWLKSMLRSAGIDITIFTAHSIRSAAASAAYFAEIDVDHILQTVGLANASTFAMFYNKPITPSESFGSAVFRHGPSLP